jgi:hypothetical protein
VSGKGLLRVFAEDGDLWCPELLIDCGQQEDDFSVIDAKTSLSKTTLEKRRIAAL